MSEKQPFTQKSMVMGEVQVDPKLLEKLLEILKPENPSGFEQLQQKLFQITESPKTTGTLMEQIAMLPDDNIQEVVDNVLSQELDESSLLNTIQDASEPSIQRMPSENPNGYNPRLELG